MKHMKKNTGKVMKRVVSIATSLTMLISSLYYPELGKDVSEIINTIKASATVNGFKEINSLEELYRFSAAYSSDSSLQYRDIQININGDIELSPTKVFEDEELEWHPIGTVGRPFGGRITLSTTAGMTQNIVVNSPMFGYVMDSVEFVNINDYQAQKINLIKNGSSDAPLFATNVVHDSTSTPATWKISTDGAGTHSGIVGTVGTGSDQTIVNFELELNSSAEVSSADNAGLICGKINGGSVVNVDFAANSQASAANITSSGANAGGLVGEMCLGSELNVVTNGTSYANTSRTVTGKTYAGGLVGKNDQGTVTIMAPSESETEESESATEAIYNALGTIEATDGAAGGVFGYYKISDTYNRFSPDYYTSTSGCSLKGKTAGGLVGVLEADGINVSYSGADSDNKLTVISSLAAKGNDYGGIVGQYLNTDLTKSFVIEHVNATMSGSGATNCGGAIGSITGNSAVYVKINDFSCTSNSGASDCSYFGGAVGDSGRKGSLLDIGDITVIVKKNNALSTFNGGGVVGKHNTGVVRLSGTTDLSQATAGSKGQIVGERTDGLVYALGSGEDENGTTYEGGWRLIRSGTDAEVDDIGTWGEVVRIAGVEVKDPEDGTDTSNAILVYNSTSHTVTVGSAVTDMRSPADFTRTALNMQLNDSDVGSLLFNGSNRTSLLANKNLTVFGTINLIGTGITGFMRDGSLSSDDNEIKFFTGKLSKGEAAEGEDDADAVVELAIGERYGVLSDGSTVSDTNSSGRGAIFKHRFNGLFARTGEGAEIDNASIGGFMNVRSRTADMNVGGAIAYLRNEATLTNVSATETINFHDYNEKDTNGQYVGGLVGRTNCDEGQNITIGGEDEDNKATIAPTINVTGSLRNNEGNNSDKTAVYQTIGGLIGYIESKAAAKTTVQHITLSATVDASNATSANRVGTAGLISDIAWNSTDTRTLALNDIDVSGTVVKNTADTETGGILGYRWYGTDVTFDDVVLVEDSGNELNSSANYLGGLVYRATGHWTINSAGIAINEIAFKNGDDTATPSGGLGIILLDGYYSTSGIYMEFMADDSYTLASGLSNIPTMTGKIYDEICACLSDSAEHILTNNTAGVISYYTSDGVYSMDGAGTRNSYNNVYNTTVVNNRSRYYYNADSNSYDNDRPEYNLLYWSLNRYAAANIKRCFTNPYPDDVLDEGEYNLFNVSYYPIDVGKNLTIDDSSFIFYNSDIEATDTDSNTKCSTRDGKSQHYMMHMGLFRNVTATINTKGTISLSGSVGVNDSYSGALICGNLNGTLNTSKTGNIEFGRSEIIKLKPLTVKYYSLSLEDSNNKEDEKPYLIKSIGDKSVLDLNGVVIYQGEDYYPGKIYASSLIGDVVGKGINLNFNNISIDGRNKENVANALDAIYGTTRSIFKNAILLNKYDVDSTSVATYNFSQAEDWTNATTRAGAVTYGKELTSTIEFRNNNVSEENRYYEANGVNGNYVAPETYPGSDYSSTFTDPTNTAYDFSSNFLPYVRYYNSSVSGAPAASNTLHEIKVNVVSANLDTGCGTYDHPYEISGPKQLKDLATMIDGDTHINSIMLPVSDNGSHWCCTGIDEQGKSIHSCYLFVYKNNRYEYYENETDTTPKYTWEYDNVRKYLANAYYMITTPITLDTFSGLGAYNSTYAFTGVIVGKNSQVKITNKSGTPFVKMSNGCVIKDLNIEIDHSEKNNQGKIIYTKKVVDKDNADTGTAFSYANTKLFYGGVIGTIMGGDNIIDNVKVEYNSNNSTVLLINNHNLDCVGGYVGVIVNGGLVFRNMTSTSFRNSSNFMVHDTLNKASATDNWTDGAKNNHMYVNPYIGRVINGYAINETTGDSASYSGDSGNYTLDNGTKNYQIADVKVDVSDSEKLYYDTFKSTDDRVNIPTGQSLFILSLITQTGAGTATTAAGDYDHGIAYDGDDQFDSKSAAKNVATHLALYDKVGNATFADKTDTSGDYYLSTGDKKNSKQAVPYIVSHYTKKDSSGNYPARKLTGNTNFMKLSTANGTYNLPKGFRGIGSICRFQQEDVDGKYAMKIYGFDGNNAKINLDIEYNTYISDKDNYSNKIYGASTVYVGFGLFNYLVQKPKDDNRTTYYLDDGYYIGKFTISGDVTVNEYSESGERQSGEGQNSDGNRKRMPAAAFVAGTGHEKYLNLYRLDLEDVTVTGSSNVAGYIGRNNIAENNAPGKTNPNDKVYVFVNACNTTRTKLIGSGGSCGGIVGHSRGGYIDLFVNTAPNSNTADTERRGDDGYFKSSMELDIKNDSNTAESGCGGILGGIRNGYQVHLWVNNVTISGYTDTSKIENTSTTVANSLPSGAGGMFGYVRKAESVIITNCVVKDISVTGPVAGGLFGNIDLFDDKSEYGVSPKIKIYNTKVYAEEKNKFSINGVAFSGGLAGQFISSKTYKDAVTGYNGSSFVYDIDGCEVYNYTITQTSYVDKQYGAGGMIGYAKQAQRTIVNSRVHDCTIKANADNNKHGMGGVVGNSEYAIWGYNIAAYNNSFEYLSNSGKTLARYGSFIGNSNSKELKIVGFTRKNNYLGTTAVSQDWGNGAANGSYIIDADYMNISTGTGHGTAMPVGFDNGTNVGEGATKNYFPYVTVSPKVPVGGDNFLTGDGVSIVDVEKTVPVEGGENETVTVSVPVAKLITDEYTGTAADNRIAYKTVFDGDIAKVKQMISDGEDTNADHDIKLTTYFTEMGQPEGYEGDDFPIIAINGAESDYYNEINAYIRTLTNTTDNYNEPVAGKYSIALYPCQCIEGVYQKVSGTQGLQLNNKKYVMVDTAADSVAGHNQITMIDISFLDPTDENKVAYHLYIPVLTKKMLKFSFSSSALQGTEYEPSDYIAKFPTEWNKTSKLAAGFDSWQTIYAQFDYSKEEMNTFLATGKGLNWNTSKTLYFNYNGNKSLANSTQFVLLDNNNNVDKEYYITKADISTETNSAGNKYDVIKFGDFTTERDGARTIDPARKFEPQTLNDIAGRKLRYAEDPNGAYVECGESEATVYVYTEPTNAESTGKKFFKAWESGTAQRYTITVNDMISETYYLSMYSFDKDNVDTDNSTTHDAYGLTVASPLTFTSDVITCQRSQAKNTEMFLGNFLSQTLSIANVNDNVKISSENHTLKATLSSTVAFTGRSANYFHKNLAGEKLYQGFFLYLNRYNEKGEITSDCTIKGQPNYSYTRSINGESYGSAHSGGLDENAPYLYVLPVEIVVPAYAEGTSWSSSQSATVNIDFGTNEVKLNKEFPTRNKATNDYKGIEINSTVKLDFLRDRVIYSNNKKDPLPEDKPTERYYIDRTTSNGILTLTAFDQAENDEYDTYGEQSYNKSALGINGNYIGTGSKYSTMGDFEHIEAGLDYDVSALPAEIFDGKHTLNFKIVLEQKVDDSNETTGYKYIPVNIEDFTDDEENLIKGYLSEFAFYGKSAEAPLSLVADETTSYLSYTYSMPMKIDKSQWTLKYTETETQKHITGNIEFNAKTNGELEAIEGYLYTNYRLKVTASISGTSYTNTDWIVYTNAKMNAQYVKKAS